MKMKVWMAQSDGGSWLCWDNKNKGLTMHLGFPVEAESLEYEKFIFRQTKREIESDCSTWHNEIRKRFGKVSKGNRVRPVLTVVTWTPFADGKGKKPNGDGWLCVSPTPWKRSKTSVLDADGEVVANCCTWNARAVADATLLSAAPKLRDAVRKLIDAVEPFKEWWRNGEVIDEAKDALALAEGKGVADGND